LRSNRRPLVEFGCRVCQRLVLIDHHRRRRTRSLLLLRLRDDISTEPIEPAAMSCWIIGWRTADFTAQTQLTTAHEARTRAPETTKKPTGQTSLGRQRTSRTRSRPAHGLQADKRQAKWDDHLRKDTGGGGSISYMRLGALAGNLRPIASPRRRKQAIGDAVSTSRSAPGRICPMTSEVHRVYSESVSRYS
jgi:hypothetical protein